MAPVIRLYSYPAKQGFQPYVGGARSNRALREGRILDYLNDVGPVESKVKTEFGNDSNSPKFR